jgi:hypothetical protein
MRGDGCAPLAVDQIKNVVEQNVLQQKTTFLDSVLRDVTETSRLRTVVIDNTTQPPKLDRFPAPDLPITKGVDVLTTGFLFQPLPDSMLVVGVFCPAGERGDLRLFPMVIAQSICIAEVNSTGSLGLPITDASWTFLAPLRQSNTDTHQATCWSYLVRQRLIVWIGISPRGCSLFSFHLVDKNSDDHNHQAPNNHKQEYG